MTETLEKMVDWYWAYGANREEYTIQPVGLYALNSILGRQHAITKAKTERPCVAFWGPSQSGKSSLLSHYIDAEDPDGSDSALTWGGHNARFSSDQAGRTSSAIPVFNPQNARSDASGLATRFYLPESEGEVDVDCPITLTLANRKQVLQALAIGYRNECRMPEQPKSAADIRRELDDKSGRNVKLDRSAFELVCDLCDICKVLAGIEPSLKAFSDDAIRSRMLMSAYVESVDKAWELVAEILWHGSREMTSLARKMLDFLSIRLGSFKIVRTSMEAAAQLEDIAALGGYGRGTRGVRFVPEGETLRILAAESGSSISEEDFGLLQACVGEMRVPLRKIGDNPFFRFLERADLLDLPGVTNHATGERDVGTGQLVDMSRKDDRLFGELLTRVYKTGKTLSVVYGQAESCSVDSFVIFVPFRREGGLSRPRIIEDGVRAWLAPYCPDGVVDFSKRAPLDLYINLSLFGAIAEELANQRNGLGTLTDLKLQFSNEDCVDYFFTSNRFAPCRLTPRQLANIEGDDSFANAYLRESGAESLQALAGDHDGLGTDYMFSRLMGVSREKRLALYKTIAERDIGRVLSVIADARPQSMGDTECAQRRVLRFALERLEALEAKHGDSREKTRVAACIKAMLEVNPFDLDPVLQRPKKKTEEEVRDFLVHQVQKWIAGRMDACAGSEFSALMQEPTSDIQPLLLSLGCFGEELVACVRTTFVFVGDEEQGREARAPFALMLSNQFLTGSSTIEELQRDDGGLDAEVADITPEDVLIRRLAVRIQALLDGGLNPSRRPSLEGDDVIDALAVRLA